MSSTKTPTFTPKNSDVNQSNRQFKLPLHLLSQNNNPDIDDQVRVQSSSDRQMRRPHIEDFHDKIGTGSGSSLNKRRLSLDLMDIQADSGREIDPLSLSLAPLSDRPNDRAMRIVQQ